MIPVKNSFQTNEKASSNTVTTKKILLITWSEDEFRDIFRAHTV